MPDDTIDQLLKKLLVLDPADPDAQFEAAMALPKLVTVDNRAVVVAALLTVNGPVPLLPEKFIPSPAKLAPTASV